MILKIYKQINKTQNKTNSSSQRFSVSVELCSLLAAGWLHGIPFIILNLPSLYLGLSVTFCSALASYFSSASCLLLTTLQTSWWAAAGCIHLHEFTYPGHTASSLVRRSANRQWSGHVWWHLAPANPCLTENAQHPFSYLEGQAVSESNSWHLLYPFCLPFYTLNFFPPPKK